MGVMLTVTGALVAYRLARRSLGNALGFVLSVGCVHGIVKAWLPDVWTSFWFDATVLGLYLGHFPSWKNSPAASEVPLRKWLLLLCGLPILILLLSPFSTEAQPVMVQLLGLRPALFFVPLVLVGARLTREDWLLVARWACAMAIVCAVVAIAELLLGVDRFFPENASSRLVYASRDVGERGGLFRIPSTFVSSHAYGGTMVALLPLLFARLEVPALSRLFTWSGLGCAALASFVSGARSPIVALTIVVLVYVVSVRRRLPVMIGLALVTAALLLTVARLDQFKRVETLGDPEMIAERIEFSANTTLLGAILEWPLGRGLGMAFGTSIPAFLADQARPQVALETEYGRIALEEGLPGLLLWVGLVALTLGYDPRRLVGRFGAVDRAMWACCVTTWLAGLIGTGMLASIPGTLLLLTQMGFLAIQPRAIGIPSSAAGRIRGRAG